MHEKSLQRALTGVLFGLLCAVILLSAASSALAINGSVTIKVDDKNLLKVLQNGTEVSVNLYKLADKDGDEFVYGKTPSFAGISEDLKKYEQALQEGSTPDLSTLAKVEKLIKANSIKPVDTKKFSAGGTLMFGNLPEGLYFYQLAGSVKVEGSTLVMQSAIVPVPFIYKGNVLYGMETLAKVDWDKPPTPTPPTPPTPTPNVPSYRATPTPEVVTIESLGVDAIINHVGDCYE